MFEKNQKQKSDKFQRKVDEKKNQEKMEEKYGKIKNKKSGGEN